MEVNEEYILSDNEVEYDVVQEYNQKEESLNLHESDVISKYASNTLDYKL